MRGTAGLLPLLAGVLEAVTVPVLAAGGIASARSVAVVLAAGVRVVPHFLATPESGAHPDYVAALLAAGAEGTALTKAFSVGWPRCSAPGTTFGAGCRRGVRGEVVGVHRTGSRERPLPKMAAQTPSREVTGTVAAMALYAGEGVGETTEVIRRRR